MPPQLKISGTLSLLRGWVVPQGTQLHRTGPEAVTESPDIPSRTPITSSWHLNSDVCLRISEYLFTSGDRLALAQVSRWHYSVLGHTAYTHIIASQEPKLALLIATLGSNTQRCNAIFHLDVIIPPRPKSLSNNEAVFILWRSRERNLLRDALVVLKLAPNLKSVYLMNPRDLREYCPEPDIIDKLMCDPDPCRFKLRSFSTIHTTKETLDFVRNQTEINHLIVLSDVNIGINRLTHPEAFEPIMMPRLHTLWATPGWAKTILPHSPVQSFGLVHVDFAKEERHNWRMTVNSLINMGGHPTVNCLTIPYEDFFWDHHSVKLSEYGLAFPNAMKLRIPTAGSGTERLENTEMSLKYTKALVDQYALSPLPSVRELAFLRPGDFWPNPSHEPYKIERVGRSIPVQFLVALEELVPSLHHVDLVHLCYRKDPMTNAWHGQSRSCRY
ncbi:hypothetical protein BDV93DRAFT_611445 [Ceratobasidium sp. AG-I]|nr:hypothetical protein BDV93DRAFT_611445 [Ceratobasidium sp. AG-I]